MLLIGGRWESLVRNSRERGLARDSQPPLTQARQ